MLEIHLDLICLCTFNKWKHEMRVQQMKEWNENFVDCYIYYFGKYEYLAVMAKKILFKFFWNSY